MAGYPRAPPQVRVPWARVTATRDQTTAPQPALFEPPEPDSELTAGEAAAWAAAVDSAEADAAADQRRSDAARDRAAVAGHPDQLPPDPQLSPGVLLGPAVQAGIADDGLHPVELQVLVWIAVLVDGDPAGATDRGLTGIARLMGRKSSSAIWRQVNRLEELGWIGRRRRRARSGVIERRALLAPGPRWQALAGAEPATAHQSATVPCRARTAPDCYGTASLKFDGVCSRCRSHDAAQAIPERAAPPRPLAPVPDTVPDPVPDIASELERAAALREFRRRLHR